MSGKTQEKLEQKPLTREELKALMIHYTNATHAIGHAMTNAELMVRMDRFHNFSAMMFMDIMGELESTDEPPNLTLH